MSTLRVEPNDSEIVVYFQDASIRDESQITAAGTALTDLCQQAATAHQSLVLDCRGVEHMSSAMIGKLVLLNKAAKSMGVPLQLRRLEPKVLEALTVTRVHKMFDIREQ